MKILVLQYYTTVYKYLYHIGKHITHKKTCGNIVLVEDELTSLLPPVGSLLTLPLTQVTFLNTYTFFIIAKKKIKLDLLKLFKC